ncbi:MAG TPA: hypothetical protein VGQ27_04215 [Steroidobacteraceae bacterium]|nr:hypothetical protein [Steroidobacteraceae bacterium]
MRPAHLLPAFVLLALAMLLTACGGGGGGGAAPVSSSSPSVQPASVTPPAPAPASVNTADLDLAARLYKGDERTPAGFAVEARPASVVGTLSTRHLKNTDFATGPQAMNPVYEVCTNDMAQAIDWSERQANWQGQYSDMVEVNSDNRMWEIVRVPRADATAMIRHRVFRCDYLDRAGSDLRADSGSAGSMNQRPLTADELKALAQYLWQFTTYNNSDYAVVSSTSSSSGSSISETIRVGQLVRGTAGGCDTVQLTDWTHTMSSTDGTLARAVTDVRSFKVKSGASGAQSCAE